jgi:hypothetical protein
MTGSDQAPDFAEAIRAWRVWRVVRRNGLLMLCSAVQRTVWPASEVFQAQCLSAPGWWQRLRRCEAHPAPREACECGIYATSIERIGYYLTETPRTGVGRVFGLVSLWDIVIECERGYRAGAAYPARLFVPADAGNRGLDCWQEIASGLEHYGVPVEAVAASSCEAVMAIAEQLAA